MDRKEIAKKFAEEVSRKFGEKIISIILFGSVAAESDDKDSDIDILIVTKSAIPDIYDIVADFAIEYSELISLSVYKADNVSDFARAVFSQGVILYESPEIPGKIKTIP